MGRFRLSTVYVAAVIAAGALAFASLAFGYGLEPFSGELLACLALVAGVALGELFPVKIGGNAGEVAFSSTFTFALLLGWGPGPALAAQLGACLLAAIAHRSRPVHVAFNLAQYVVAIAAATVVLDLLHGRESVHAYSALDLLEVTLAAGAFFVVNTGLVAGVIAIHARLSFREQLRDELRAQTVTEGIMLGVAPLALLGAQSSPVLVLLVAMPLLAIQRAGRQALDNERLALSDALTGLANRTALSERTEHALACARRDGSRVAILLIDLDRFKDINDTLGHQAGDRVLRAVAERITAAVREIDTVARLGGDEFAVLLPDVGTQDEALAAAHRVLAAIARPLEAAHDVELQPRGSAGVACSPAHGTTVEELLRHADVAMYAAKEHRCGASLYALSDGDDKLTQLKLAGRLGPAIAGGEIALLFQPQVSPRTGRVTGAEALARWHHPDFDVLGPDVFIPLAERSGHMHALTVRVIEDAVAQLARWTADGLDLTVAVNLSASSLGDPGLPAIVAGACERSGVDPSRLVLEITEDMLLVDPERGTAVVEELAALGAGISVDDFGTGFSSLEQLVRLPAVELKIDRSFVGRMEDDTRSAAIVRSVAELGTSLGLRVVAEGVETEAARATVQDYGCERAQGYLWSPPVTADAFAELAADGARVPLPV